jgi:F0F1-type ATP synthase membrane subunit c/vacuolar-type H+-ATPase subunit K
MSTRRILLWGGLAAGVVLVAFGIAAIVMGFDGRSTVRDSLEAEQIYFGDAQQDEAVARHASQWSGEQVRTGEQARAFAEVIHDHALALTGGLAYAETGRFVAADDTDDPAGTSDPAAAQTDEAGNPVPNPARSTWVTATALSTALNMSYMAEQMALFGIVVGIALVLSGIGFAILALAALGGAFRDPAGSPRGRDPAES